MAIAESDKVPRGDVVAKLNFFVPPADGAVPFNYVDAPPPGEPQNNFGTETQDVLIHDIRGREHEFSDTPGSLDRNAFLVVQNLPPSAESDFLEDESIKKNYYPEVEDLLLKNIPGANRVVIFDHTVRRGKPGTPEEGDDEKDQKDQKAKENPTRTPVTRVHIDQTAEAAAQRVHRHLPVDETAKLLQGRYRIINVWRPLNKKPVETFPLAFASSQTVRDEDVVAVEHRYPAARGAYVGQTAGIRYHEDQQWHYLSGMGGDERLLLECFDSEGLKGGAVKGGRLAHSAFEDPRSRPDAEHRESIEVRTLVFGP